MFRNTLPLFNDTAITKKKKMHLEEAQKLMMLKLEILKIQIMHYIQRESSINSFFNDQLQEKRGFKYFLSIKST